jgi:hypothetical protein
MTDEKNSEKQDKAKSGDALGITTHEIHGSQPSPAPEKSEEQLNNEIIGIVEIEHIKQHGYFRPLDRDFQLDIAKKARQQGRDEVVKLLELYGFVISKELLLKELKSKDEAK